MSHSLTEAPTGSRDSSPSHQPAEPDCRSCRSGQMPCDHMRAIIGPGPQISGTFFVSSARTRPRRGTFCQESLRACVHHLTNPLVPPRSVNRFPLPSRSRCSAPPFIPYRPNGLARSHAGSCCYFESPSPFPACHLPLLVRCSLDGAGRPRPMAVAVVPRLGGLGWMDGWIMDHAKRGEASCPVRLVLLR